MSILRSCDDVCTSLYWDPIADSRAAVDGGTERAVPYFFLSYARGPDDNGLVAKFYGDLCVELRARTGQRSDDREVGFYDTRSIGLGQAWPGSLVSALSTCRVMLAMCSPTYFRSEPCGKEFQIFWERKEEYRLDTGMDPGVLLPVKWAPTPEAKMPRIASEIQNYTEGLGEAYQKYGLRQLMRLTWFEDDYNHFVFKLAEMINEVAEAHRIPEAASVPRFDDVRNAFEGFAGKAEPAVRPDVHFMVAAPNREEAGKIRKDLQFYGEGSLDWAPYKPTFPTPIGRHANRIAGKFDFSAELSNVDDLPAQVTEAVRTNQIVVLLVDTWAIKINAYQQALDAYEDMRAEHTSVMIPWNARDSETLASKQVLEIQVKEIFYRRAGHQDPTYRWVMAPDTFEEALGDLLAAVANRVIATGRVYRRPGGGDDTRELPILEGP